MSLGYRRAVLEGGAGQRDRLRGGLGGAMVPGRLVDAGADALQGAGDEGHNRDLARELGTSEHLVRRRLDSLVRRGMLGFRTDFARREGGWPAEFITWLSVPHDKLDHVGAEISAWHETRICMSTVGSVNLMVMSQVHRVAGVSAILEQLRRTVPEAAVSDPRLVVG